VSKDLVASGGVSRFEALGLHIVRSPAVIAAPWPAGAERFPVLLFSPGNGTNVEFYDAFANDLASHGYVVVAINHPYDVAAVKLSDGRVARFVEGPAQQSERPSWTAARIAVRTADLLTVLNRLSGRGSAIPGIPSERLDLTRVGAFGHSLGGITAAQACLAEVRVRSCANLDGLQRGGPWSATAQIQPTVQPFLFLTKEQRLSEPVVEALKKGPGASYWVIIDGASHQSFSDAPLLQPGSPKTHAEAIARAGRVRRALQAFFDRSLRGSLGPFLDNQRPETGVEVRTFPPKASP
jgi:predicted dienelactone hydrolase